MHELHDAENRPVRLAHEKLWRVGGWITTGVMLGTLAAWAMPTAQAQTSVAKVAEPAGYKVANELQLAIDARQPPAQPWVREAGGQRLLRVLVTAKVRGSDQASAREDVVARGGQVVSHSRDTSLMVAVLPAGQVRAFAQRPDVLHVAPDRPVSVAAGPTGAGVVLPGFEPGTATLRGRNDLALLGE